MYLSWIIYSHRGQLPETEKWHGASFSRSINLRSSNFFKILGAIINEQFKYIFGLIVAMLINEKKKTV